ncbi:hypothetical protein T4C_8670, partial [Trichinella pseudospiralis]
LNNLYLPILQILPPSFFLSCHAPEAQHQLLRSERFKEEHRSPSSVQNFSFDHQFHGERCVMAA